MSRRLRDFYALLSVGVFLYLRDCAIHFNEHPDLPWYERGVNMYMGGFPLAVAVFVLAFVVLLSGKE